MGGMAGIQNMMEQFQNGGTGGLAGMMPPGMEELAGRGKGGGGGGKKGRRGRK